MTGPVEPALRATGGVTPPVRPIAIAAAPQQIGDYAVERLIARTNLSEVFLARHARGDRVALKRLLPELKQSGGHALLAFRREAALLAEVAHPNVVRVFEVGEADGLPFTCLELIEGSGLDELITRGPVPIADAVELLLQIARGLSRIHEAGIVHADLKPANCLVTQAGAASVVKIVDFGLAANALDRKTGITGTPHYMAPEQTPLVDWPIDARTDLYALGVLAFELLTGKLPFDEADTAALLAAHVSRPPPCPSDLRPDLPPILERMVLKLLEKNPARRYQSAGRLAVNLEQLKARLKAADVAPEFPLDAAADGEGAAVGEVFVGRDRELAELEAALARARDGRPGAVYVGGVAGVGKSALVRELRNRSITSGARFAAGKCFHFSRGLPYYVLAEALTQLVQQAERAPDQQREALFERMREAAGDLGGELVKLVPAFARLFPDAKESVYLGEGKDRLRFLRLLGRVLESVAPKGAPLVLLLDDLQWADTATLEALDAVVDAVRDCSLLIVGTYRSEEVLDGHPFKRSLDEAKTKPGRTVLALARFSTEETALLIAESLRRPRAAVPAALVERVFKQTDGNPLFVHEVMKALVAERAVILDGGALLVDAGALERASLPSSVVDVVLRRIEGLDDDCRRALGTAALIGRDFSVELLARAAMLSPDRAYQALNEAAGRQLLQPPRDGRYRFHHDRVQEACTRLLDDEARRRAHQSIVLHLEESQAEREEAVFDLAEHALRCDDRARAWRYCKAAAELAARRYANDQALAYAKHALDNVDDGDPAARQDERKLRLRLGELYDLLGQYDLAIAEYRRVIDAAEDDEARARVLSKIASSEHKIGNYKEAKAAVLEALRLLGVPLKDAPKRRDVLFARLRFLWARLRARGARGGADAARQLRIELLSRLWLISIVDTSKLPYVAYRMIAEALPLGPSRELSIAHRLMTITLAQLPRPPWERALAHGRAAVAIGKAVGAHLDVGIATLYTSDIYCWSARYREALPWLKTAGDILSSLGNMWELANVHIFSFLAHRGCGRLDDALTHAFAIAELGERIKAFGSIANGNQKVADVLYLRGETARADKHLATSLEIAEARNLKMERFQALKIRGQERLRQERYAEARADFEAAIKICESPGTSFFQAYVSDTYLGYAEAFLNDADFFAAAGGLDGEEGKRVLRTLAAATKKERALLGHLAYCYRVKALVDVRRGRPSSARRGFQRAIDLLTSQDRPLDAALAALAGATALEAAAPDVAAAWLLRARAAFEERRTMPLLARCDRLLARLGRALPAASSTDDHAARALEALIAVSRQLMESRSMELVIERIVDSSVRLLGAERGFLFTHEDGKLTLTIGRTADGKAIGEADAQISMSVLQKVDDSGNGLAVSDTEQDEALRDRRSIMAYQLRSVLCAPLRHGDEKIGCLYLDSQISKAVFGEQQLALLQSFAAQAAIAVTNARQFAATEELNRELDRKVLERTRELESAYAQIERAMDDLKSTTLRLAEAKREALEKELDVARRMQLAMVPPPGAHVYRAADVAGYIAPASFCGGDFWTCRAVGDKLVVFLGDVTGHGVGPAMITTVVKGCIELVWQDDNEYVPLDRLFSRISNVIHRASHEGVVMTGFAVEVDPSHGKLRWCIAGHNPQLLIRANGEASMLAMPSGCLGDGDGRAFVLHEIDYAPGDRVVLFTDGLVECANKNGHPFGVRRLKKAVTPAHELGAQEIVGRLRDAVMAHADGLPPDDDITIVALALKEIDGTTS